MKKVQIIISLSLLVMLMFGITGRAQQLNLNQSDSAKIALQQVKEWVKNNVLPVDSPDSRWNGRSNDINANLAKKKFVSIDDMVDFGQSYLANLMSSDKVKNKMPISLNLSYRWTNINFHFFSDNTLELFVRVELGEFTIYYRNLSGSENCMILKKDFSKKDYVKVEIDMFDKKITGKLSDVPFIFGK